eukprot:scaffold20339_cov128-Cylindrotheca_fusiformis.AAC.6
MATTTTTAATYVCWAYWAKPTALLPPIFCWGDIAVKAEAEAAMKAAAVKNLMVAMLEDSVRNKLWCQ